MTELHYDWMATLLLIGSLSLVTVIGKFLVFKVPAFARSLELNRKVDKTKMARKRFRDAVKINNKAGLITNLVFFATILPWCIDLAPRPLWRNLIDVVAVLAMFDFFYYFTHRFIFHGKLMRKLHALHHQARQPTYIDALYVHPLETIIGLGLFLASIPLVALLGGAPLNAFAAAFATLVFTQLNTVNHAYVNLPYFPFKTIDHFTSIHAAHHIDMDRGNYATMTMIFDWAFGTLEKPVRVPLGEAPFIK
jgi:sterol desaturase/sphingolipid hydroxylase (fatty acid hydroxylase superfamily)